MVLEAGGAVSVGLAPRLEAEEEIAGDAGGAKLIESLPDLAAADVSHAIRRRIVVVDNGEREIFGDGVLKSLVHPGGEKRFGESAANFQREWGEVGIPRRGDENPRVDTAVGPPTLIEIVRAEARVGGLERFGDRDEEPDGLGAVREGLEVSEMAEDVWPIEGGAIMAAMRAAVENDLQLIPGR